MKHFEKMNLSDSKSSSYINEYNIAPWDIIKSFPLHFTNILKCLEIYEKKNNLIVQEPANFVAC